MGPGWEHWAALRAMDVAGASRLPVTAAAKRFLDACCDAGFADEDFACVARVLRLMRG